MGRLAATSRFMGRPGIVENRGRKARRPKIKALTLASGQTADRKTTSKFQQRIAAKEGTRKSANGFRRPKKKRNRRTPINKGPSCKKAEGDKAEDGQRELIASFWLSASDFWLLASGFWLLASGFWLLASGLWPLASCFWPLASGLWLLASGLWPLVSDFWLLVSDSWFLASSFWLLASGSGFWFWLLASGF